MSESIMPATARVSPLARIWRRVRIPLAIAVGFGLLLGTQWHSGMLSVLERTIAIAFVTTIAFTLFERWPRRMPGWFARWVLQVIAVGVVVPVTTFFIYMASTAANAPPFWKDSDRLQGFLTLTVLGVLIAPWMALGTLVRQREAFAREQALAFELERSELERQALDARLHLLQAQVAPHFLFNTLANVQALVDAGSPRASEVLRSLTAYLRAAVPLLNEPATTIGRELQLVRAYLELMHMRIPDRLQFDIRVDESALSLQCPPTTMLTLVENAVRHGIDPSEEGGRIEIDVERRDGRCVIRVSDSGVGLRDSPEGLGTGLTTLRERLQLVFGGDAQLRIAQRERGGVRAEVEIPAREGAE